MGCDIHAYIEYSDFNDKEGKPYWSPFGGSLNLGRDYSMFARLAGVRGDESPLYPPKGLPPDLAFEADTDVKVWVTDDGKASEGECTTQQASAWLENGSSTLIVDKKTDEGRHLRAVSHPDWHTHSWLTAEEYRTVLATARLAGDQFAVTYYAALAAMESLERHGAKVRLVFWFDN